MSTKHNSRYCRKRASHYPCSVCKLEAGEDTVQCSACNQWTHRDCVPLTEEQFARCVSEKDLRFTCPSCATVGGKFNFESS